MPDPTDRAALVATIRDALAKATPVPADDVKLNRYDHGGGRLYRDDGTDRQLIADFYDEGNREFYYSAYANIAALLSALAADAEEIARLRTDYAEACAAIQQLERNVARDREELSEAAAEINVAGPVAHRIRVLKQEWSEQIRALTAERDRLRAAVVLAAIPLEALHADNQIGAQWMAPSVQESVAQAVQAIRAALAAPTPEPPYA